MGGTRRQLPVRVHAANSTPPSTQHLNTEAAAAALVSDRWTPVGSMLECDMSLSCICHMSTVQQRVLCSKVQQRRQRVSNQLAQDIDLIRPVCLGSGMHVDMTDRSSNTAPVQFFTGEVLADNR